MPLAKNLLSAVRRRSASRPRKGLPGPSVPQPVNELSPLRAVVAVAVALLGCLAVWVVVPYNNFVFKNTYLSDSYLPEIVIGFLLLIVLAINPLLKRIGPRWMLNRRQVGLICSLMLLAAVIPSNGLMRMFPRFVAEMNIGMNEGVTTARIAATEGFRQELFPDPLPTLAADGSVVTHDTPVSHQFVDELEEGASIPWRAWLAPMAIWGMLIIAVWAMMLGLGGIVYPQWRDRERLPFPLLNVYHAIIGDPDDTSGRSLPEIFYSRVFWVGCIAVFLIHLSCGLNIFTSAFPSFPLRWELRPYFSDNVLRFSPQAFNWQIIFFSVVGVAYFIPNRYAISIWGWVFAYSWYVTLGSAYIPAFRTGQIQNQSFGMLLAISVWVLWLGRAHWKQVGRAMFGRAGSDAEARRNAVAGWIFALGCAGIVLWLRWAGCSLWWSLLAMLGCAAIALLMARIIAETGIPALWTSRISIGGISSLFPMAWLSPTILLLTGAFYAFVTRATAVNAAVMSTMAMGADRKATATQQSRLLLGGLVLLLAGFILCGAVHLHMGYQNADVSTAAKASAQAINQWDRVGRISYSFFTAERGDLLAGFSIGSALLWACSRFPAWPIHPVGILFVNISIGSLVWFSVFLGWLLKTTITHLFGGGAYRKARPLFLGLIMGELLTVIVWALVPLVIVWATGADPATVPRYILMQYP